MVDLFVGLATFTRLDEVNGEDAIWVAGMNRIRPRLPGDRAGTCAVLHLPARRTIRPAWKRHMGSIGPAAPWRHWIVTMPGMIAVINGVLAGLIVGLAVNTVAHMAMSEAIVAGAGRRDRGSGDPRAAIAELASLAAWRLPAELPVRRPAPLPSLGAADRGEDGPAIGHGTRRRS